MKSERNTSKQATTRREEDAQTKTEGQVYGLVSRTLGDGRFLVECDDNVTRTCTIRGNMRNRVYVRDGDIVLVNLYIGMNRDDKGMISYRYSPEQVRDFLPTGLFSATGQTDETSFEFI